MPPSHTEESSYKSKFRIPYSEVPPTPPPSPASTPPSSPPPSPELISIHQPAPSSLSKSKQPPLQTSASTRQYDDANKEDSSLIGDQERAIHVEDIALDFTI